MIPPDLETRAREMVLDAIRLGGELWQHVSPATIEMMVEAVAMDLRDEVSDMPEQDPAINHRRSTLSADRKKSCFP